ncbi:MULTISPECIES: NAD(P)/FAD-dependent oxidoreductase [Pseudomonas]|uniref:NAD(P)/FAD-dependent oxidoreductase n=1 Tax=Pseudomonas TaxID=286 RepID=UPI00069EA4AA|nr:MULTISPECIES: FAD-binding oxidoreductase [Pseudomonas]TCV66181.1 glycine/D-amino acid oxidase-like deaminating enzyme [Pseudomonas fluorescens]
MFLRSSDYVPSYYSYSCADQISSREELQGSEATEVVVVGAGFSGLHTALRLALAGKRVTVLEASRVAWAASGRNGGQAILGWSCDMPPLEAALGYERARQLWETMRWAAKEIWQLPIRHGFDIDYKPGHLWTSVLERRIKTLTEWQAEASHRWGHHGLQFISEQELPNWVGTGRYKAGLLDPEGGHLNPLKLSLGLADSIEKAGGKIYEKSKVVSFRESGSGFTVVTEKGQVRADVLVLACNAYIDDLYAPLSRKVLSAGSYQVATAPLRPHVAKSLIPSNVCVTDNQFILDYFRLTPDHRLLFGGGTTYMGGLPKDIAATTRPYLERVFPQLEGVGIDYAWGGHLDITLNRTPDISRKGQLYWMLGYSGHGVLPTLAAARAVSNSILGDEEDLKLYEGIKNKNFPGGKLCAAPIEAVGKTWYRLRDLV